MQYNTFTDFLKDKNHLCIIQAENPDGDSIGSALALDYLLADHEISLYCPVQIPQYLRYFDDWSRITDEFDFSADGYIIVDTASSTLLSKLTDQPEIKNALDTKPVFVLDHHETEDDLPFPHSGLIQALPACCELIYRIAREQNLIPAPGSTETEAVKTAAKYLVYGILSDTLGLTSASSVPATFRTVADLLSYGLNVSELEEHRREFSKKSERIFRYKADLIQHTEFFLDGRFASVHIPWEEIHEYSNEYNPNALIIEELRLVENVDVAVSIKTYPDGRLTGKIRTTSPIADQLAGYFGGGGHPYAAGFRAYDISYEDAVRELITAYQAILEKGADAANNTNEEQED